MEVTESAMARYLDRLDHGLARTVWCDGVARAWWKRADGTITNAWPGTVGEFEDAIVGSDPAESFAEASSSPVSFMDDRGEAFTEPQSVVDVTR